MRPKKIFDFNKEYDIKKQTNIINLNLSIMSIFINKKYSVKKIKKTPNGWKLYPTDKNENPIFISRDNYSGKMPPFTCLPWQKLELELSLIRNFQVSATLNGHKLFEIQEQDYPSEVKKFCESHKELLAKANIYANKRDDAIKAALADYLKLIPINPDLEDEISKLNICLRGYMQLHLFKGQSGQEQCQRLNLMMLICKIAQRIFSRHRDPNSCFGSTIFLFKYGLLGDYPEYWRDIKEVEKFAKENGYETTIVDYYYEVDRLIESSLPPTQDENLKRYLNYVARGIIANFADDFDMLDINHALDGWGRRCCTDEEDYKRCHRKMKLLQYKSFVLSQQISEKNIAGFMNDYSLK